MSRFQKNAIFTAIFLAVVLYPALYFTLRDQIKKEQIPLHYNHPDRIPKVSLGVWELGSEREAPSYSQALREMLLPWLAKETSWIFWDSRSEGESDIELRGRFKLIESGIQFQPKLYLANKKWEVGGTAVLIPWNSIGTFPERIHLAYEVLLSEVIKSKRLLFLAKERKKPINTSEILDQFTIREFQEYALLFEGVNFDNRLQILSSLSRSAPQFSFFAYRKSLRVLEEKGIGAGKEIWASWEKTPSQDGWETASLAFAIGDRYFQESEWEKAKEFFEIARKEREKSGFVYQPEYAEIHAKLGSILLIQGKKEETLYHLSTAKEMYVALRAESEPLARKNLWNHAILMAELKQKEIALSEFFSLEPFFAKQNDFFSSVFYYDLARLEYQAKAYSSARAFSKKSRSILFSLGFANHELSFLCQLLEASAFFQEGKWVQAKAIWDSLYQTRQMLAIEDKVFFRSVLFNLSLINQVRGNEKESEEFYRNYVRLTPYSQIVEKGAQRPDILGYFYPDQMVEPPKTEFTNLESAVIRSYTGKYIFTVQEEEIRARTYENRLEDTNEFLRDLLDPSFFGTKGMQALRRELGFDSYSSKGGGIVFVDIGPALNNPEYPGVTSQSVAYHFPEMEVVLLELPKETDLFFAKVSLEKKEQLYSFKNIRILSADGVGPFLQQFENLNQWPLRNRGIPSTKNKLLVFRAANSIDIYETFNKIQPHFQELAKSFPENPILYFFNRSILVKRKNESKFSLIGYQSVRGFHHNFQSLDRNGEPPYSLAEYTLKVE